jgi:hypothetical protein
LAQALLVAEDDDDLPRVTGELLSILFLSV